MARAIPLEAIFVLAGGCVDAGRTEDRLFAVYLEFMERNQDAVDELEEVRDDAAAKKILARIRENTTRARDHRPPSLKGNLGAEFRAFLARLKALEEKPWKKERFRELMNGCTRCHERRQE